MVLREVNLITWRRRRLQCGAARLAKGCRRPPQDRVRRTGPSLLARGGVDVRRRCAWRHYERRASIRRGASRPPSQVRDFAVWSLSWFASARLQTAMTTLSAKRIAPLAAMAAGSGRLSESPSVLVLTLVSFRHPPPCIGVSGGVNAVRRVWTEPVTAVLASEDYKCRARKNPEPPQSKFKPPAIASTQKAISRHACSNPPRSPYRSAARLKSPASSRPPPSAPPSHRSAA